MNLSPQDLQYVTSLEEILWGVLLVAVTLVIHGFGMVSTLRVSSALKDRFQHPPSFARGMAIIILATGLMILVHLFEVAVWAGFFLWKDAMPNQSLAFYFALMDYTTLGSNFNLPLQWRLLEGMIGIAGMMSFAWSTGILLTLAQTFQDDQLEIVKRRRAGRAGGAAAAHARESDHPDARS